MDIKNIKDTAKVYVGGFADQRDRKVNGSDDVVEVAVSMVGMALVVAVILGSYVMCH